MVDSIPLETIRTFAKTICAEAKKYGFRQLDIVRLINEMMDESADLGTEIRDQGKEPGESQGSFEVGAFPLTSDRLSIRLADPDFDMELLRAWMADRYGRYFLLSCATAQSLELDALLRNPRNVVGIVIDSAGQPIGAVAYLDIDSDQNRAELRKLIGEPSARGKGFAEEATRLWVQYGGEILRLEKIYVSTLQTHLRNIRLNESIGFRVEGLLLQEVLIAGVRYDVLRMGLCFNETGTPNIATTATLDHG